jgi:hypothetical protein
VTAAAFAVSFRVAAPVRSCASPHACLFFSVHARHARWRVDRCARSRRRKPPRMFELLLATPYADVRIANRDAFYQ